MGDPPDDSIGSTGPIDRQTLRLLERQLSSDPLVAQTTFNPDPYEPRLLRAALATEQHPDSIAGARIDVRWFTTGDFSFHYVEERQEDGQWECRWDRHPNPHTTRLHFHEPPVATEVTELELASTHPLEMYSTVLGAIEERLESVWDSERDG